MSDPGKLSKRQKQDSTKKYAVGHEITNFCCTDPDKDSCSYIETVVMIGILIGCRALDFISAGCSSGQGMMLACNSMPGVICGYAPTPKDAYLFAQINNGNAISLPLVRIIFGQVKKTSEKR